MATVKTSYVSEYVLETARAIGPAGELDRKMRELASLADALEKQLLETGQAGQKAGDGISKTSQGAGKASRGLDGLIDKLKDFKKTLGLVAVGAGLAFLTKEILEVGARFEQIGVQLRTVFGDEAEEVFERFRRFAATTPFTLDAITESAIRLKAVGLNPTQALMTSIGDTAAAFGKDISVFSQAVIQATVGEMEMLKQFGIIARQQGDVVRFTFQGVTTEVQKEAGAIVDYLQKIGEVQFAGAMADQSQTLTGRLSTLKDAAAELAAGIFDLGLGGAAGDAVAGLTALLGQVNELVGGLRDEQTALERGRELHREYQESLRESTGAQDEFTEALRRTVQQQAAQNRFQELRTNLEKLIAAQKKAVEQEKRAQAAGLRGAEFRGQFMKAAVEEAESYEGAIEAAEKALADFVVGLGKAKAEGRTAEFLGLEAVTEDAAAGARSVGDLKAALEALKRSIKERSEAVKADKDASAAQRDAMREEAKAYEELIDRQAELTEALQAELAVREDLASVGLEFEPGIRDILFPEPAPFTAAGPPALEIPQLGEVLTGDVTEASSLFGDQMLQVAFDFGQTLADQMETGPVHDAAFGLFQGVATAAGQAIGEAIGGPAGGQTGAALGGIFSSLFKGLFSKGSDEAFAQLEAVDGQLQVVTTTIEGKLRPALDGLTGNIIQAVNMILAEFGGTLLSGEFGVKIRRGGEDVVRAYWGGVVTEFESEAEAASFLVAKIISTSLIEGLGQSIREALEGGDFESAEELVEAMRFAEGIDAALRTPWEQFVAEVGADTRTRLAVAADLGISTERVVEAERRRIQALVDEQAALVRSVGGVQDFLGEWEALQEAIAIAGPEGVAQLETELLAMAEASLAQADAAGRSADAFVQSQAQFESFLEGIGIGGEAAAKMGERWREMAEAGVPAEKIVEELVTDLEGLSSAEVQQALRNFRQNFVVDLLGQLASLADLAGKGKLAEELRARAMEISTRMQLLSIRTTLQAALAAGVLSAAQVQSFNAIIQEIQRGIVALGGFGALGRQQAGGGGGRAGSAADVRTREDALADFDRLMLETGDILAGVTAEERRRLDVLAQLDADLAAGLLTAEEYASAILNLDMVQAQAAQRVADEATAFWEDLGRRLGESPFETRLRTFWEDAQEAIEDGGQGIPEVFARQVEEWFRDGLEGADSLEDFEGLRDSWTDFLATLPPDIRGALEASGIGQEIAAGVASSVRAADVAAFLAAAVPGVLPELLEEATDPAPIRTGGGGGGRRGGGRSRADQLAELREELDGILEGSAQARLGPLKRELDGIFESFEKAGAILRTLDAAADDWNDAAREMAATLARFYDDALAGARDLLGDIRGRRQTGGEAFVEARARFESLTADLPSDLSLLDPDQITAIVEAGRQFRETGADIFGEGFGVGLFDPEVERILEQLIAAAPEEQDLVLLALQHLQEQAALQLDATTSGLGSGGAIVSAVDQSVAAAGEASLAELVEIARLTGVLSGTVNVLDELSPQQLDELQETVSRLLSLESLSDAQRAELEALQTVLDQQDIIDLLSGTLDVADTLSADELRNVLALLNGTLDVADQLAPSQLAELRGIIARLLSLDSLSEEQRNALLAAQSSLGGIDSGTAGVLRSVDAGTAATESAAAATDALTSVVQGQNQELNRLRTIADRIGAGNTNDELRRIRSKLDTVISRLDAASPIAVRLDTIASRIGVGNMNARLVAIEGHLQAIRSRGGSLGTAG